MKATLELEFESREDYEDLLEDIYDCIPGLTDYNIVREDECVREDHRITVYEYRDCTQRMGVKTDERDRFIETIKERWPDLAMRLVAKGLQVKWERGDCSLEDYMVKANKVGCMDDELLDEGLKALEREMPKEDFHGLRVYKARLVED